MRQEGYLMNRCHATPWLRAAAAVTIAVTSLTAGSLSAQEAMGGDHEGGMELTSSAFTDGNPLPAANIYNAVVPGTTWNVCSATGAIGGDQSPPLAWKHVPPGTQSFVIVLYDRTAGFTHWAMYNIAPDTRMLPQGAGAAGSSYGTLLSNDFPDPSYDGPCPPFGLAPEVHHYVFTLYALDTELDLGVPANFQPYAYSGALYQGLIKAASGGHILASAELVAHNSGSVPPSN
jgi:Raf kinase inhibitor-like YbhB/YbcL family protein